MEELDLMVAVILDAYKIRKDKPTRQGFDWPSRNTGWTVTVMSCVVAVYVFMSL